MYPEYSEDSSNAFHHREESHMMEDISAHTAFFFLDRSVLILAGSMPNFGELHLPHFTKDSLRNFYEGIRIYPNDTPASLL